MNLKAIGISDVSKVDFVDKPEKLSYLNAFNVLIKLDALDIKNAGLS